MPTDKQKTLGKPSLFFVLLLAACACIAGFLILMSHYRYIDGDEGHFIFAGRLVLEGKAPYQDFFYQQMPLMPYIYAAWFWLTGVSWYGARLLNALFGTFSVLLLGWCVYKELHKKYAALAAMLLCTANMVVFVWFSPVKVHSPSFFLLIAAYALWSFAPERQRNSIRLLAGLLIAFSLNIRLMMLVVIPAFYLDLWLTKHNGPQKWTQALYFTLGLALGCCFDYYFLATSPVNFFFDNIGYHAIRTNSGLIANFHQKLEIFKELIGLDLKRGLASFQQLCLTAGSCAYFILMLSKKRITLSMSILVLLTTVNLLPTPTFLQYFSVTIPFMILQSVAFVTLVWPRLQQVSVRVSTGLLVCGLLYLAAVPGSFQEFTFAAPANGEKTIPNMKATAQYIDSINPLHRPFLADWPGYYIATKSPCFPGMENNFGLEAAKSVSPEFGKKCKLFHPNELAYELKQDDLLVVVRDPFVGNTLHKFNYFLNRQIGNSFIYLKQR